MKNSFFARWQANFWAGLIVLLPGVVSIGLLVWLFGTVANLTDTLLIFLPSTLTHMDHGAGKMYWYWSLAALAVAVFLISVVGLFARNYFGRKVIEWIETAILRVPLLSKVYGATKQVNDAFSASGKTAFRTVVLVEYPKAGLFSIGFITSEQQEEASAKTGQRLVCVFVPTTPNPTSGFLVLAPEDKVMKLNMTVAEAIKYVISLGSLMPGQITTTPLQAGDAVGKLATPRHD